MNVLVVSTPGAGHVRPLLPLVTSLVAGGDRVVVVAAAPAGRQIEGTGAEFLPAGHGEDVWFARLIARTRGAPGEGLAPERINHYFLPRLFGEIATDDMIDDVLAIGRALGPDVIVFESCALAGPLVGELLGTPAVHHLLGPIFDPEVFELVDDAVSPLWRSFGRQSPGYAGVYRGLTIELCPPSVEVNRLPGGDRLLLRPAPRTVAAVPASARPLIYATLGTFFNSATSIFRDTLVGLSDEPVDVVVTVGSDRDPSELDPIPANAQVERFIPQATLLPSCAVVVHHGGAGTTFGCLAQGLPQVVIPQGADNFINAAMVERAGVGLVLRPSDVDPDTIRRTVRQVLHEPRFTAAARRISEEIAAMPGPDEVATQLRARLSARRTTR
ncbi:MAG: glycosyltransferase [Acidimicrobiales bacterium]